MKTKIKQKTIDEVLKARGEFMDEYKQAMADKLQQNRNHTNFAEEIYQQEKTDKFFNRILIPTYIILAICAIILVIVNIW